MPRAKLDHAYCLTAQCEPGKRKTAHWCTHIPGFVLEVRYSGGNTYALRMLTLPSGERMYLTDDILALTDRSFLYRNPKHAMKMLWERRVVVCEIDSEEVDALLHV